MRLSGRSNITTSMHWRCAVGMTLALGACTTRPEPTGVHTQALVACRANDNPIQCENLRQVGTGNWRLAAPAAPHDLEGYASKTSVDCCNSTDRSIDLYVSAAASGATQVALEVFRMGYYGGLGARSVFTATSPI